MKREGRHHGVVKSHPAKKFAGADVARSGPSNASKFSGKCRKARCKSCHFHPVSKSKDKTKGSYKLKSCDVALNHRLVSWRIAGDDLGTLKKYKGVSASEVLRDLSGSVYSSNYSVYSSNYSCEETGSKEELGFGLERNYDGFSTNLAEGLDDFVGFGGLFDEIEIGCEKPIENSDEFVGFGALFDEIGTDDLEIEQLESDSDQINGEKNDGIGNPEFGNPAFGNPGFEDPGFGDPGFESDEEDFYIVGIVKEFSDNEDWLVVEEI